MSNLLHPGLKSSTADATMTLSAIFGTASTLKSVSTIVSYTTKHFTDSRPHCRVLSQGTSSASEPWQLICVGFVLTLSFVFSRYNGGDVSFIIVAGTMVSFMIPGLGSQKFPRHASIQQRTDYYVFHQRFSILASPGGSPPCP